jgi:hypothetical protein
LKGRLRSSVNLLFPLVFPGSTFQNPADCAGFC